MKLKEIYDLLDFKGLIKDIKSMSKEEIEEFLKKFDEKEKSLTTKLNNIKKEK